MLVISPLHHVTDVQLHYRVGFATPYTGDHDSLFFPFSFQDKIRKSLYFSHISNVSNFALSKLPSKISSKSKDLVWFV